MSEDGGSPRPDPNSMETGDTVPPGTYIYNHHGHLLVNLYL